MYLYVCIRVFTESSGNCNYHNDQHGFPTSCGVKERGLTERTVDRTLLLLAAISVLYRLRSRFGGGAAEPNGTAKASVGAWG